MSESFSDLQDAFAAGASRFARIVDDDAFWRKQELVLAKAREEEERDRAREQRLWHEKRLAEIPNCYREPWIPARSKLPPAVLERVARWTPDERLGIGLCGKTGQGKTRALCAVLLRLRCRWLYLPASKFSQAVTNQWSREPTRTGADAVELLRAAKSVPVLLLDDLGDETHSESVTSHLKDLIEYRTSRRRAILWSSNLSPGQITAKHGERGAAIVRRLAEFTWVAGG